MRSRRLALTGPSAAALYELDGFRDRTWPELWCAPIGARSGDRIIRTRGWEQPEELGDVLVCPVGMVLRHLNVVPSDLHGIDDKITSVDRVELAVEHALRKGITLGSRRGGRTSGDALLSEVVARRGDEPATESYAETRAVQLFRSWGITPWRQIPVRQNGRIVFRADFMLPFEPTGRPDLIRPSHGLLVEVDGREFHENEFEHDKHRGVTYDELGYHWSVVTPNQVERRPALVRRALEGAFRRAGHQL